MQGNPDIDVLMIPTNKAIKKHVKDRDAFTEIYNRAYEAVMISMEVKEAERNKLAEAVGLMTTLKPTMVVDSAHPVEMALEVSEYITQLTAERDELREQLAAQETISEIQQMALQDKNVDISMTEANSLLRSAYQIALRNGESTNWEAFRNCVYKELLREHNLNIGNAKTYSDNNKPSDSEGSVTQNDKCIWVELDDPDIVLWATSCGNEFHIEFDKPSDNHMKYCCYCGKEIAEGE